MTISLGKKEIIHFVGIGGIGMSGLALIMKGLGFNVKGSDQQSSKNIDRLKKNKIFIQIGHKKKNLSNATIGTKIKSGIIFFPFISGSRNPNLFTIKGSENFQLTNFIELFFKIIGSKVLVLSRFLRI